MAITSVEEKRGFMVWWPIPAGRISYLDLKLMILSIQYFTNTMFNLLCLSVIWKLSTTTIASDILSVFEDLGEI